MNDLLNRLWMNYFIKSPWFDVETIGRLYESFRQETVGFLTKLSGKTRAFIVLEENLDTLLKNFSVKPDEEILTVKEGFPLQKLIDVMNAERNEKIFFIMLPKFPFNILAEVGFVRGKDFVDAGEFSSKYNSYPLIKAI